LIHRLGSRRDPPGPVSLDENNLVFGLYAPLWDRIVTCRVENEIFAGLRPIPVATRLTVQRVECDDAWLILSIRRG
jgi:hypothetical protein